MLKRFSIYSFSAFIPVILGFFLFPIFTNYLTPEEYGIRAIILLAVVVFNVVSDFGTNWIIRYKFFRFTNNDDLSTYISSLVLVSLFLKIVMSVALFSLKNLVFPLVFSEWNDFYSQLLNIQILVFLLTFINNIVYPVLILENKALEYTTLLLFSFFVNSGISLLLVIHFNLGLISLFYAELARGIFYVILSFIFLRGKIKFKFDSQVLKDIVKIGLPALPKNLFEQVTININSYAISVYMGVGDLGQFQKSEFVFNGLKGFQRSFSQTFSTNNIKRLTERGEDLETGRNVILFIYFISVVLVFTNFFMRDIFILLAVNSDFYVCATYAPLIGFSILFSGFSDMFVNNILVSGKTYLFTIKSIIGGIAVVLLNIVLIPKFGVYGAIFATIISSIISVGIEIFISETFLKSKTKISYFSWILIILTTLVIFILNESFHVKSIYSKVLILLIYTIFIGLIDRFFVRAVNWELIIRKIQNLI